jgi:hypothetical protein
MTPPVELPTVHRAAQAPSGTAVGDRPAATITRARYEQLAGRVKLLSWLSLAGMTIEGAVAIAAGIVAGFTEDSCQDHCCAQPNRSGIEKR